MVTYFPVLRSLSVISVYQSSRKSGRLSLVKWGLCLKTADLLKSDRCGFINHAQRCFTIMLAQQNVHTATPFFEYNAIAHCKRWSPPVSGSGCTNGRKNWSWVKALWDGAKTNTYIHHTVVFRRSLRLNRRQPFVSSSSIRLWIQFMGFVFIKSFSTFHYHGPRQATLKGHSMNFTHKGQFTRYGAWTNSCIMSSVVLVGACYKIPLMMWTACVLHWGCEVKMMREVNTLRRCSNERSRVVALQELVSSVFWVVGSRPTAYCTDKEMLRHNHYVF